MKCVKYDPEVELKDVGSYPAFFGGSIRKFNTPITPRENAKLLYEKKLPLWAPRGMGEFNMNMLDINRDNDARGPKGGPDMFGVEWVYVEKVGGSMVRPGAPAVKDINRWEDYVTVPDVDSWDWAGCYARFKDKIDPERMTMGSIVNGFFERLISFMDFGNAAVAMIDDEQKPGVHRLFSKLCDIYERIIDNYKKYFDVEIINFHDDWGSQRESFFSLETCEEMLLPYMKRMVDAMHSRGIYFDFHSCGKIERLVPVMIAAGMDSWGGQEMNDKYGLKQQYGDALIWTDQPRLVPEDAPDEAAYAAAEEFMAKSGKDGGCLVGFAFHPKMSEYVYALSRQAYYDIHSKGDCSDD